MMEKKVVQSGPVRMKVGPAQGPEGWRAGTGTLYRSESSGRGIFEIRSLRATEADTLEFPGDHAKKDDKTRKREESREKNEEKSLKNVEESTGKKMETKDRKTRKISRGVTLSTTELKLQFPIKKGTTVIGPFTENEQPQITVKTGDKEFNLSHSQIEILSLWSENIIASSKKLKPLEKKAKFQLNLQFDNHQNSSNPKTVLSARECSSKLKNASVSGTSKTPASAREVGFISKPASKNLNMPKSARNRTSRSEIQCDESKSVCDSPRNSHQKSPRSKVKIPGSTSKLPSRESSSEFINSLKNFASSPRFDSISDSSASESGENDEKSLGTVRKLPERSKSGTEISRISPINESELEIEKENDFSTSLRGIVKSSKSIGPYKLIVKPLSSKNSDPKKILTSLSQGAIPEDRRKKLSKEKSTVGPNAGLGRVKSVFKRATILRDKPTELIDEKLMRAMKSEKSFCDASLVEETEKGVSSDFDKENCCDSETEISCLKNVKPEHVPSVVSVEPNNSNNSPCPTSPNENDENYGQRMHIVNEILSTEISYVQNLELTLTKYQRPLENNSELFGETPETIRKIFVNMEIILGINRNLLHDIETVVSNWNSSSLIGPIFEKIGPFLKIYTTYSNQYSISLELLNDLMKRNEKFVRELNECRDKSGAQLKLTDLLIMPIQRIPRYMLLLQDLLKHTPATHPDYFNLKNSIQEISNAAHHINEEVRRTENQKRVEEMVNRGIKLLSFLKPHRHFLREGALKVTNEATVPGINKVVKEVQHFVLFTDILIHVRKDIIRHEEDLDQPQFIWPLNLVWVVNEGGQTRIIGPNESLTIVEDQDNWPFTIEEAVYNYLKTSNSNPNSPKSISSDDPLARYGEYTYPHNQGTYQGYWHLGKREGQGTFCLREMFTYSGQWKADKQHGTGVCNYGTGEKYKGEWARGLPHGKGELKKSDGTKCVGMWVNGAREGFGTTTWASGDSYTGNFKNDCMCGEGTLVCKTGLTYSGNWQENVFHGNGKLKLPSGLEYEGEFEFGVKQGQGVLTYPSGFSYSGQFDVGLRHGNGVLIDCDGKYEGQWVSDLPHGNGKKQWTNGTKYKGQWNRGYRHGQGKCKYPNGTVYSGGWQNDKRHGEGNFKNVDSSEYKGMWVNGYQEGKGILLFQNGSSVRGNFHNGQVHKTGVFTGSSTDYVSYYEGEWLLGRLHGKGHIRFSCGDAYKGGFKNGSFHGTGTYTYSNGVSITCKWNMGVKDSKINIVNGENIFNGVISSETTGFNLVVPMSGFEMNISPFVPTVSLTYDCETSRLM